MFQHILVPLDGSERAERALPVAVQIARVSDGSLVLLRVVPPSADGAWYSTDSPRAMREALDARIAEAFCYLAGVAESEELSGINIITEVLPGEPALTIFPAAHSHHADLIVMCTRERAALQRWGLGSVTQKVARHSPIPVFILHDDAEMPMNLHRSVRVLVTLDGSSFAEATLLPSAYLSAALSAPVEGALHLVRVLPVEEDAQNVTDTVGQAQHVSMARTYLHDMEQQLRENKMADLKLHITTSVEFDNDVAGMLIRVAETGETREEPEDFAGCDVIAMATRGHSGLQRWVLGSTTERVLAATKLPLLIVRPHGGGAEHEEANVVGRSRSV